MISNSLTFFGIYSDYYNLVSCKVRSYLHSKHYVEDVIQIVWMKVFQTITNNIKIQVWPCYLSTLCRTTSIDYLRKESRFSSFDSERYGNLLNSVLAVDEDIEVLLDLLPADVYPVVDSIVGISTTTYSSKKKKIVKKIVREIAEMLPL